MRKYICLLFLLCVSLLHAQFIVEKHDGTLIPFDGDLRFTQDSESGSWSTGTTYSVEWDLTQIKRIYADESAGTGKLVFNANGGTGTMPPVTGLKEGQEFTLPRNTFVRDGFRFIGWSTSSQDTEPLYQDEYPTFSYYSSYNAMLYAIWEPSTSAVEISFDANGGSGSMEPLYTRSGQVILVPPHRFSPPAEGYECKAYDTSSDGYSHYRIGSTVSFTESCTLYAYWSPLDASVGGASETYKGQTVYVEGVNVKEEDWVQGDRGNLGKYVEWKSGCGWYDTYQDWYNFCWAATASNVIHWWFDRNADYIARYRETHPDLPEFEYRGKGSSDVFSFFLTHWTENRGNYPVVGFNWFIQGSENGVQASAIGKGGLFKDVFENAILTENLQQTLTRRIFNTFIEDALKEGRMISFDQYDHAMTAWGFDFDENGYVSMIYYTDSNTAWYNSDSQRDLSLCRIPVKYDANKEYAPYMETSVEINGTVEHGKIYIVALYSYSLGTEYWEAYFAAQNE